MISNQNKDKKGDVINSGAAPEALKNQPSVIEIINKINFNSADELKAILNDSEGAIVKNKDLLAQLSEEKNAEAKKKFYETVQTIKLDELGDDNCLKSILQSWGEYLSGKQLDYLVDCEEQKKLLQSLDVYELRELVLSNAFKQFCLLETATGEKKKAILSLINFDDWNRYNYIYHLLKDNMKSKMEKDKARIDKALKKFTLFVGEHIENLSDDQVSCLIPNLFNNEKIDEALANHKEKNKDKNSGGKNKIDDKNQQVKIEDKNDPKQENELQNAREKINKRIDKLKSNKLYQNLFELRNIKYDMADGIFDMLSKLQENERSELIRHLLLNPRLYWSHVRTILNCLETDEKDNENKKQVKQLIVYTLLSKKNEDMQDSDLIVNDSYILENANTKGVINLIDHCGDKLPEERVDARIKKIKLESLNFSNLKKLLSRHWDKISSDRYNALIDDFSKKYAESKKQKKEDYSSSVRALERIITVGDFLIDQISKLTSENKDDNKDKIKTLRKIGNVFFSQLKNVNVDGLEVCWGQIQKDVSEKANVLREALRAQNKIKDNKDFKEALADNLKKGYENDTAKYVKENKKKIEKWESQKDKAPKAIENHNSYINKFIRYNLTEEGRKIFSPTEKDPKPYFTKEQIKALGQFARSFDKDTGTEVVPNFILKVLDLDFVANPDLLFDSDCLFEPLPDGSKPILEKFVVGDKKWAENQSKITKVFKSLTAKSLESLDLKFGYENNKNYVNYVNQKPTEDYSNFCKTRFCELFYTKLAIIRESLDENGNIMLDGLDQLSVDSRVLFDFCLGSWIIKNRDFCKEHSEELEQIIKSRFNFGCNIGAFKDNKLNGKLVFTDKQKDAVVAYMFIKYRTKDLINLKKNLAMLLEKTGDPQNVKFNLDDIGKVAKFMSSDKNKDINKDILQCLLNNMLDSEKKDEKWLFEVYSKYCDAYGLKITDKTDYDIFPKEQKQEIIKLMKSGVITVSDMNDNYNYSSAVKQLIKDASGADRAEIFLKQVCILKQSNKNETIEPNNKGLKKLIDLFGDSKLKLTQNQLVELLCNVDVSCKFEGTAFGKCFPYYYNDSKKNNSKKDDGLRISCSCENTVTKNDNNRLTMVNYIKITSHNSIKEKYANIVDFRNRDWADEKDAPNDDDYWKRSDCYNDNDEELNKYEKQRSNHLGSFSWTIDNMQIDSLKKNTLLDCYNDLKLAGVSENSLDDFTYDNLKSHLQKFEKNDIENLGTNENSRCLMKYLWNVSALCCLSFDNEDRKTNEILDTAKKFYKTDIHNNFKMAFSDEPWSNDDFLIKRVFIRKLIWTLKDSGKAEGLNWETFMAICRACKNVEMEYGYLSLDETEKKSSEEQLKINLDLIINYVNQHFIDLFVDGNLSVENWETIIEIIYYNCSVIRESFGKQDFSNLRNQYLDSLCKKLHESIKILENDKKLNIAVDDLDKMVNLISKHYFKKNNEEIQDNKEFLLLKEYVDKLKKDKAKENQKKDEKIDGDKNNKENDSSGEKINEENNQVDNKNKNSNKPSNIKNLKQNNYEQEEIANDETEIEQENDQINKKNDNINIDQNEDDNSRGSKSGEDKNVYTYPTDIAFVDCSSSYAEKFRKYCDKLDENYEQEEIENDEKEIEKENDQGNNENEGKINNQSKKTEQNKKDIQNKIANNGKKLNSKNKIEFNNLDKGNNDELHNNNLKNTDIDVNQIISISNSFAVFCNGLAKLEKGIDLNKLNFDAAKLCFWNCFRAFFSVLFFRPKVNCSFWHLVYLKVVYENIRSNGSSYYFEAPEESNNPSQNSDGKEQYKKNARWFNSALNEAKKQTERANANPKLDKNDKNQNQNQIKQ